MGISSGTTFVPKRASMLRQARESTPRVRRPRKSIFSRPSSGVKCPSYWVMMPPPLVSRFMGTWSAMGSRQMMVAQACTPSPRTWPSMDFAASMTAFTSSSVS